MSEARRYHKRIVVGRLQLSATKYVHLGPLPDRHVWHFGIIYDRKRHCGGSA